MNLVTRENSWIAQGKKVFQPGELDFEMSIKPIEGPVYTTESMDANPDDSDEWEIEGFMRSFRLVMRLGNLRKAYESGGCLKENLLEILDVAMKDLKIQLEKPYVPLEPYLICPEILEAWKEIKE